jgi:carbon monoxide dehydrogenase subunit G
MHTAPKPDQVDVTLEMAAPGRVRSATARMRIDAPVARVWRLVEDVEGYAGRVPMIHKVHRQGDRATLHLKFKLSLFSVGFHFVVDVVREHERSLELRWVEGEPKGIRLAYALAPLDDGAATELRATGEFDLMGLGWFAKYFLRHHPEIELGVLPGVAIGLLDAMRRAADASRDT